ncbi:MAG TPA: serine/threonine protein kinase [Planctomycetaceae bacterium]|nr:serine/threonine protein kinase [Planctomycetaceae bacterium]
MLKYFSRAAGACCKPDQLEQLLAGQLSSAETQRVSEHLDACATCRQIITEMSAGADWWDELPTMLATGEDTESDDESFPIDAMEHLEFQVERLRQSGLISGESNPGFVGRIGRYELHEILGTGGTGIVFRATDTDLHRIVAIKVLAPDLAISTAARRRFAREGQACAAVVHENVVAIHHVSSSGAIPYLVMQYVDGMSLQQIVRKQGALDPAEALRIIAQIASALQAAHIRGIIHRDVKPSNILVEASGQHAWISDFGLARAVDDMALTRTGFIAGTPHYMSPEQARGLPLSHRSDLFSLGSVIYFMLTGRPPFEAERTLAVLRRICDTQHATLIRGETHVPAPIAKLVDQLLAKAPEERPEDAGVVAAHCHQILANKTDYVSAIRVKSSDLRNRAFYTLATSAVLLLLALTLVFSQFVTPWYRRTTESLRRAEVLKRTEGQPQATVGSSRTFNANNLGQDSPAVSGKITDADIVPAVGIRGPYPNTLPGGSTRQPLQPPAAQQSIVPSDAAPSGMPPTSTGLSSIASPSQSERSPARMPAAAPEIASWTQSINEWNSQVQSIEFALSELAAPTANQAASGVFSMPDDSEAYRFAEKLIWQLQESQPAMQPNESPIINRF